MVDLGGHETIYVDLYYTANQKTRQPTCHFGGEVKHEYFVPESVVPDRQTLSDVPLCRVG